MISATAEQISLFIRFSVWIDCIHHQEHIGQNKMFLLSKQRQISKPFLSNGIFVSFFSFVTSMSGCGWHTYKEEEKL